MIVNCVLWSHKLRNYAAMNIFFYASNNNKILLVAEGMRVDIKVISSLEKKNNKEEKQQPESQLDGQCKLAAS